MQPSVAAPDASCRAAASQAVPTPPHAPAASTQIAYAAARRTRSQHAEKDRSIRFLHCYNTNMADKTALVLLAEGAEEMELVISVDVMRRAGIRVTVAGLAGTSPVRCRRDTFVCPDASLADAAARGPYDAVVMPGGIPGAKALSLSPEVGSLLRDQEKSGRYVCAICAAPTVLKTHGVAYGKNITSFPPLKEAMMEGNKYNYKEEKVVVDGNIITSRGPGTAFDFALRIVEELVSKEEADKVAKAMVMG